MRYSALALLACGIPAACGETGEYYEMPQAEVASRLVSADVPRGVENDLYIRPYKRGISEVVWEVTVARQPVADITAHLSPEGEGTRVDVTFAIADNEIGEAARQDLAGGQEFVEAILRMGMTEHIDATLENRAFDEKSFTKNIAKFAMANPAVAKGYLDRAGQLQNSDGELATKQAFERKLMEDAEWHDEISQAADGPAYGEGYDPNPDPDGW